MQSTMQNQYRDDNSQTGERCLFDEVLPCLTHFYLKLWNVGSVTQGQVCDEANPHLLCRNILEPKFDPRSSRITKRGNGIVTVK